MAAQGPRLVQRQKVSLSARLRFSLKILSLGQLELKEQIVRSLAENPFLEETVTENELSLTELEKRKFAEDIAEGKSEFLEELAVASQSLQEYLNEQLEFIRMPAKLLALARAIISEIDDNGFTRRPHQEISSELQFSSRDLKYCLEYIRLLEPSGICAEDTWQALGWQAMVFYPGDSLLIDIIEIFRKNKDSIGRMSLRETSELADVMHIPLEIMQQALDKLHTLDPFPARNWRTSQQNIIYPEIIYAESGGTIEVIVKDQLLPGLKLNEELYRQMQAMNVEQQWEEAYHEAENLIRSIRYRQDSLQKIAHILLLRQSEFFLKGSAFVKPLNLSDVAELAKLHVSTVSRIISQKYCQCKWGIFPLKFFFPAKIKSSTEVTLGSEDLRQAILSIIATEDPTRPLSDNRITVLLRQRGFDIQRRTVAKYRNLLHIKPAAARKVVG